MKTNGPFINSKKLVSERQRRRENERSPHNMAHINHFYCNTAQVWRMRVSVEVFCSANDVNVSLGPVIRNYYGVDLYYGKFST